jgi:transposase
VAEVVVAEIGLDMNRFPTAGHLSSWAGLASGNHESAGKRQSGRTTPGNVWLKSALVQAAWASFRTKGTHLSKKFRRIAGNRGKKRAAFAVAHTMLVIIYHLLKESTTYQEIAGETEAA